MASLTSLITSSGSRRTSKRSKVITTFWINLRQSQRRWTRSLNNILTSCSECQRALKCLLRSWEFIYHCIILGWLIKKLNRNFLYKLKSRRPPTDLWNKRRTISLLILKTSMLRSEKRNWLILTSKSQKWLKTIRKPWRKKTMRC